MKSIIIIISIVISISILILILVLINIIIIINNIISIESEMYTMTARIENNKKKTNKSMSIGRMGSGSFFVFESNPILDPLSHCPRWSVFQVWVYTVYVCVSISTISLSFAIQIRSIFYHRRLFSLFVFYFFLGFHSSFILDFVLRFFFLSQNIPKSFRSIFTILSASNSTDILVYR